MFLDIANIGRHLHFGPRCNGTGDMEKNYGHYGAILEINMAVTIMLDFRRCIMHTLQEGALQ